jgi:hypothetical protein
MDKRIFLLFLLLAIATAAGVSHAAWVTMASMMPEPGA